MWYFSVNNKNIDFVREIQEMAEFLQMTALKEEVARKKLEDFIGNLLQRTEKAEGELAVIKSLNTTPQNTMQRSNSLPQSPHPHMVSQGHIIKGQTVWPNPNTLAW